MIEIIIDKKEDSKIIGVIENGKLIEMYEEEKNNKHERNEGNIYVGIVQNIIPGMPKKPATSADIALIGSTNPI